MKTGLWLTLISYHLLEIHPAFTATIQADHTILFFKKKTPALPGRAFKCASRKRERFG